MEKKLRALFTFVVGPTVVGFLGHAMFGWAGDFIGGFVGLFVGWWAGRKLFP